MSEAKGTQLMNIVLSVLYAEGYWICGCTAKKLGLMMRSFLLTYQECAYECLQRRLNRFILVPKAHMISHTAEGLIDDGTRCQWVPNPLATSNQQSEDYIGRPCRLSRRVHARRLHTRVMDRSLLASYQILWA